MKKVWFCLIFLCLFPFAIFGQSEYFSKDTSTTVGVTLIDGGEILNSKFCQIKIGKNIIQYSPYEVHEYGFKDGRVYLSKEINLTDSVGRVFLQRLSEGSVNLYYYKTKKSKIFFLEKDSAQFIEILKKDVGYRNYKDQLSAIMSGCSTAGNVIRFVSYNSRSLAELVDRYNNCNSEPKPFPHFRYGIIAGYEFARLMPETNSNDYFNYFEYSYNGGFAAGLFIDNPITASYFSLHTELIYSRHGYSYYKQINKKDIDFVANISSLKLPVLLRYTHKSSNYRPFINAGGIVSYNIKNENQLYETVILDNSINITSEQNASIGKLQAGCSIGAGIEKCLNIQRSIFMEVRYNRLLDGSGAFSESYINLMTGINF